jgi:hypothetical protein
MASLSEWFSSFLSRSEASVHPKETTKRDLTSDRRKSTLAAEAYVEIFLHSEIQPKFDNEPKASPTKLQKLLSEGSSEDNAGSLVSPIHTFPKEIRRRL